MVNVSQKIMKDIDEAKKILINIGCAEIYLFGSIVEGSFTETSDIDFAVVGLSKSNFFQAYGELLEKLNHSFDLIGLDYKNDFSNEIRKTGKLERVV